MTKLLQLLAWLTLATALGQSNVFGVFRRRRRVLQEIQEKRVKVASRKGFAGPHGELLTVQEFEALQAEMDNNNNNKSSHGGVGGPLDQILYWLDRKNHRHPDKA